MNPEVIVEKKVLGAQVVGQGLRDTGGRLGDGARALGGFLNPFD